MKVSDIPACVDEIVETGCDNCAVGHDKYVSETQSCHPTNMKRYAVSWTRSKITTATVTSSGWRSWRTFGRSGGT
jgi:hypothetical protein